jgi:alpha-glucosidase (family GH31 glycosyl hydrolase)
MVGDRLLVAALFAGEPSRKLALPPGAWFDYWTGQRLAGNTAIEISRNTRNIPIFVKSGALLPLAPVTNSTSDPRSRLLEVRIFGDGSMPFTMDTPEGRLHLHWDAAQKSGSIEQAGTLRYSVSQWRQVGGWGDSHG